MTYLGGKKIGKRRMVETHEENRDKNKEERDNEILDNILINNLL